MTQPNLPESRDSDAMKSMQIMNVMMPIMSTVITFSVPAALAVYWLYQNLLGMGQQLIFARIYPMPKFAEEDFVEAEKVVLGNKKYKNQNRPPVQKSNRPAGERPRSLHHIDDDETETTKAPTQKQRPNQAPKSKSALTEGVTLKEEPKAQEPDATAETKAPEAEQKDPMQQLNDMANEAAKQIAADTTEETKENQND